MSWDGKMYDKYRIEHTDGTPLKGKKYFVLRLDSDDPAEAARVAAAMRAYKSEPRNCDVGTEEEQSDRFAEFCRKHDDGCGLGYGSKGIGHPKVTCPVFKNLECSLVWAQMPYAEGGASE
ncbi:MAG: hypothetical protein IJ173_00860 [Kiritimatiellae bacterium]|nr:hypothetical protein [Kiritimatiellia bacterium]